MAFSSGGKGPQSSLCDINVTPMVDVMLVLLIIFMVSAPLMQTGVDLELPVGSVEMQASDDQLVLSIDAKGRHYLNDTYLKPEILVDKVKGAQASSKDKTIYLRGDKTLPYGKVMELLSFLRESGVQRVSLITEPAAVKDQ